MTLKIVLENSERSYYPGDFVRGRILYQANSQINTTHPDRIRLKFEGRVDVEWKEVQFHDPFYKTVKKSNIHFKDSFIMSLPNMTESAETPTASTSAEQGSHRLNKQEYYREGNVYIFPFEYCLPEGLAPSIISKYGRIAYMVEAMYRLHKKNQTTNPNSPETPKNEAEMMMSRFKRVRYNFEVNSTLDLNEASYHLHIDRPVKIKDSINICSFFHCKLSPIYASLKIEKCGFSLGESIKFRATIKNLSSKSVENIQICLMQEVICTAGIESITYKHIYRKSSLSVQWTDVLKGTSAHWEDKLMVPIVPPTRKHPDNIININYFIKLSMKIYTIPIQRLYLTIPVVIGTIPLKKSLSNYPLLGDEDDDVGYLYSDCSYTDHLDEEDRIPQIGSTVESFQIDESKDNEQFSTLSSIKTPLRTVSGVVHQAEQRWSKYSN